MLFLLSPSLHAMALRSGVRVQGSADLTHGSRFTHSLPNRVKTTQPSYAAVNVDNRTKTIVYMELKELSGLANQMQVEGRKKCHFHRQYDCLAGSIARKGIGQ